PSTASAQHRRSPRPRCWCTAMAARCPTTRKPCTRDWRARSSSPGSIRARRPTSTMVPIREDRRRPRRRLVRGDVVSPDDVRATVLAVAHYIDARKWKELPELFAATVAVDYTSLFGGTASQTKASELVGGWRTALEGVVTQHLLGPIDVRITREG